MIRKVVLLLLSLFLAGSVACSKRSADPKVVVEIPAGFSGNFVLEMGTRDAAPLPMQGDIYMVAVPGSGKVTTSTMIEKPTVIFKNSADGSVWGYSQSTFTTGDGIAIGGKIEFFVGTKKEYEAEEGKKHQSGKYPDPGEAGVTA
ncbi:MAG: hypothetical protein WAM79_13765 [Candidatus Sulfotelmatobacter sp.]